MADDTELKTQGLDKLIKAFKGKLPVARVGIIGTSENSRSGGGLTNAMIGAKHEFGALGMPMRSFLRIPIAENMQSFLGKSGAFTKEVLKDVIKTGSLVPWLTKIGIVGEAIVAEGFASNGFGKWAPWRGSYQSRTGNILVDSTQLKNSITSDVK